MPGTDGPALFFTQRTRHDVNYVEKRLVYPGVEGPFTQEQRIEDYMNSIGRVNLNLIPRAAHALYFLEYSAPLLGVGVRFFKAVKFLMAESCNCFQKEYSPIDS